MNTRHIFLVLSILLAFFSLVTASVIQEEEERQGITSFFGTLRQLFNNFFRRRPRPTPGVPEGTAPGPTAVPAAYPTPGAVGPQAAAAAIVPPGAYPVTNNPATAPGPVSFFSVSSIPHGNYDLSPAGGLSGLIDQTAQQAEQQLVQLIGSFPDPQFPPAPVQQTIQQHLQNLQEHGNAAIAYNQLTNAAGSLYLPTTVVATAYVTQTVTVTRDNRFCRFFQRNTCNPGYKTITHTLFPQFNK